jgi:excinuclease ABC subunit B
MQKFEIAKDLKPAGDQPHAIAKLVDGLEKGYRHQTLLGVTGSGKTFTVANVIAAVQKPTLVIAHNKTLAAQLANEFKELFPKNLVNYFVSYYDYYQPEAYIPSSDTYIDKEALINDEIDKLRHAATTALLTRRDVIVVASVSCIYGLGAPEVYAENIFRFKVGDRVERKDFARKLVELQFTRTNADLKRGTFRLRGENWEIMPPDKEIVYRLEVEDARIKSIYATDPVIGLQPSKTPPVAEVIIPPAKHFITEVEAREKAIGAIQEELKERLKYFEEHKKFLEAERLERRTKFDIAMIREIGYCHGIENYSRHLSGRAEGEPPATLLDYFQQGRGLTPIGYPRISADAHPRESAPSEVPDFLTVIDESHITVPQIQGMYEGDASRKRTLVEYGFRLPSAKDNRPLKFSEFESRVGQVIFTSATPGPYELKKCGVEKVGDSQRPIRVSPRIVEQIIRPTGLVDPKITIRPARGQVNDLIPRIEERVKQKERVLVTTLTKKMAEDLTEYLRERGQTRTVRGQTRKAGIQVAYLHSDVKTLDRIRILTNLRRGGDYIGGEGGSDPVRGRPPRGGRSRAFGGAASNGIDVLVGVNLLREGLDLPEVSLVAILDADKEGFLRSETSLIQTIGRAARNVRGEVLIYADHITGSIKRAVGETERRRKLQLQYNKEHGITPKTVMKKITSILPEEVLKLEMKPVPKSKTAIEKLIKEKEREMREAAQQLNFELAAILRDELKVLSKSVVAASRGKGVGETIASPLRKY